MTNQTLSPAQPRDSNTDGKLIPELTFLTWQDLPGIALYMDQVVTLTTEQLAPLAQTSDDKLLTPAMINNYVKRRLLEAPERKKYNKSHLSRLLMISVLKRVLTISETAELLRALSALVDQDHEQLYVRFCQYLDDSFAWANSLTSHHANQDHTPSPQHMQLPQAPNDAERTLQFALHAFVCQLLTRHLLLQNMPPPPADKAAKKSKTKQ